MTRYNEEEFKKQLKQPFMWDSVARDRFEDSEFSSFLTDKDLYKNYEITVVHNGKLLKDENLEGKNNESEIDDLLFSYFQLIFMN